MGARAQMTGGGVAVTLPFNPRDGARLGIIDVAGTFNTTPATIIANGMKFDGAQGSITLDTAGLNASWMFRADLGDWKPISNLALVDDLPYPEEFDRTFINLLAMEMFGDYFGTDEPPPTVVSAAESGARRLAARYVPSLPIGVEESLLWGHPGQAGPWAAQPYQNYFGFREF
jgi:hypothetical protein